MTEVNGKPLTDCTLDELHIEYDAGSVLEDQVGLTDTQLGRLIAIERELFSRPEMQA